MLAALTLGWAAGIHGLAQAREDLAPPHCTVCQRPIEGAYTLFGAQRIAVCSRCARTARRCERCSIPYSSSELETVRGRFFCRACLAEMPECAACGLPISGAYYYIRHREGKFCASCMKGRAACSACGRPVGDGAIHLGDGREICRACSLTSIETSDRVGEIFGDIQDAVAGAIEYRLSHALTIRLVALDDPEFTEAVARAWPHPNHLRPGTQENGVFIRQRDSWEILILRSLPRELFYETLAHEYGHAIHAELAADMGNKKLTEGFAQWIAAIALERRGFASALARMHERDDLYGRGFRMVLHRSVRFERMGAKNLKRLLGGSVAPLGS